MRRLGLVLLWLAFLAGFVGTTYLGLDTFGYLPHQVPQLQKVDDLKGTKEAIAASRTRRYLIELKTKLDKRIITYPGSTEKKKDAKAAMNKGIELFAKKDYSNAEKMFKHGLACFTRKGPAKPTLTATSKPTAVATTPPPTQKPTLSASMVKSLEKELNELETRLNAITDPNAETDEAWLMLDRACNSIRSGDVKNAKYFLTETDILIDNLEP